MKYISFICRLLLVQLMTVKGFGHILETDEIYIVDMPVAFHSFSCPCRHICGGLVQPSQMSTAPGVSEMREVTAVRSRSLSAAGPPPALPPPRANRQSLAAPDLDLPEPAAPTTEPAYVLGGLCGGRVM